MISNVGVWYIRSRNPRPISNLLLQIMRLYWLDFTMRQRKRTYKSSMNKKCASMVLHGGLNQEKSQKWCLDLGPIYLRCSKSVLERSRKFIPVRQRPKTLLEVTLLSKVNFFNSHSKNFTK